MTLIKGPGWPDARGWVIVGFFALEAYLLRMIELNDKLLSNASFMQLATTITAGGVLLIGMNMFGGTKSGAETSAKLADAYTSVTAPPAESPSGAKKP